MANRTIHVAVVCASFCIPTLALAGPCSDGIADLGRKLSSSSALGPVTTGTLTGAGPTTAQPTPNPGAPGTGGTSASNTLGGTAGTKEANASVGNLVATSPQDVRRQQEGLPTAASTAAAGPNSPAAGKMPDRDMSMAKMELEKARMLDQANDPACKAALDHTRQLMN